MAYFEGILPQDRTAVPTPKVAPGLLALLNGTPIAGQMGAQLAQPAGPAMPGAPGAPGPALPSGPAPSMPAPPPPPGANLPTPPAPGLPLPDPTAVGFEAAARGAQQGQVFDSPVASLASAALRAIQSGVPAFRAQRQANREAQYVADLKAAQEKKWTDYVGNDKNFEQFGTAGQTVQNYLRGLSPEAGQKYMTEHGLEALLPQNTLVKVGEDGLYDTTKSGPEAWVRRPTDKRVFKPGEVIQATDPLTGQPVLDAEGNPTTIMPAGPAPVRTTFDRASPEWLQTYAGLFGPLKEGTDPTKDEAAAVNAMIQRQAVQRAVAGRPPKEDEFLRAVSSQVLKETGENAEAARSRASALPGLYNAQQLLTSGQVNTGLSADIAQLWDRIRGAPSAAATQEYAAEVMGATFPELRGALGAQFTEKETRMFLDAKGGDLKMRREALENILANRIRDAEAAVQAQNARVGSLARKHHGAAGVLMEQYTVPLPQAPRTTPPAGGDDLSPRPGETPEAYMARLRAANGSGGQ